MRSNHSGEILFRRMHRPIGGTPARSLTMTGRPHAKASLTARPQLSPKRTARRICRRTDKRSACGFGFEKRAETKSGRIGSGDRLDLSLKFAGPAMTSMISDHQSSQCPHQLHRAFIGIELSGISETFVRRQSQARIASAQPLPRVARPARRTCPRRSNVGQGKAVPAGRRKSRNRCGWPNPRTGTSRPGIDPAKNRRF